MFDQEPAHSTVVSPEGLMQKASASSRITKKLIDIDAKLLELLKTHCNLFHIEAKKVVPRSVATALVRH